MSNKTWMVAQREYLENVRTKTFWIGILIVPVLIVGSIFIQKVLAKAKDLRKYAVLDYSEDQWLSKEVEKRRGQSDLSRIFDGLKFSAPNDAAVAQKELTAHLEKFPANPFSLIWDSLDTEGKTSFVTALTSGAKDPKVFEGLASKLTLDWEKLGKQAKSSGLGLDILRFERVAAPAPSEDTEKQLNLDVANGKLFAYFVIGKDPLQGGASHKYVSNNLTDDDLNSWYSRMATETVRERRVKALGISSGDAKALLSGFEFKGISVSASGDAKVVEKGDKVVKWAPVAFLYMLWIAVFTAAQMLLTNTIEEKSNRLIEVLLSSVSPMQLMAGKVLGIGATGLTIVGSWVFFAFFGLKYGPELMGMGSLDLNLVQVIADPRLLFSFVAYFLGGYLLYAAVLVGIGSVCNSLKEAQNLMQPVFICLMIPLLAMVFVTQDPNGGMARALTYVPMFTPFLMMNRAGGPPPTWEYVASTVLIVVSIVVAFWGAAKIFRIGILMTGKPPKVREILGWLRAPIGAVPHSERAEKAP